MRYLPNLPGKSAQIKMAPLHRIQDFQQISVPEGAVESAVLIVLIPSEQEPYTDSLLHTRFIVIQRNCYPGVHSGQISFPGGKYEQGDKDITETACREAREELGIDPADIDILGLLTPLYVPPSNFIIYPVLSVAKRMMTFTPDPREVCGYTTLPLMRMDPANSKIVNISAGDVPGASGLTIEAPAYVEGNFIIWGATAMILSELHQLAYEAKLITSLVRV